MVSRSIRCMDLNDCKIIITKPLRIDVSVITIDNSVSLQSLHSIVNSGCWSPYFLSYFLQWYSTIYLQLS